MKRNLIRFERIGICLMGLLMIWLCFTSQLNAQDEKMKGWEKGSVYDRLYDAKETEKFRATVVAVRKIVPLAGMSSGVGLEVKEDLEDEEVILVHVCPQAYMDEKEIGIKVGDRLKIKGAWAEINGKDVFMASKIKRGDYFELKIRLTKDGSPFWSMDPKVREEAKK